MEDRLQEDSFSDGLAKPHPFREVCWSALIEAASNHRPNRDRPLPERKDRSWVPAKYQGETTAKILWRHPRLDELEDFTSNVEPVRRMKPSKKAWRFRRYSVKNAVLMQAQSLLPYELIRLHEIDAQTLKMVERPAEISFDHQGRRERLVPDLAVVRASGIEFIKTVYESRVGSPAIEAKIESAGLAFASLGFAFSIKTEADLTGDTQRRTVTSILRGRRTPPTIVEIDALLVLKGRCYSRSQLTPYIRLRALSFLIMIGACEVSVGEVFDDDMIVDLDHQALRGLRLEFES